MKDTRFILASASPRRKELLSKILNNFEVMPSQAGESFEPGKSPVDIAMDNALAKALEIARANPDAVVIGADTIVVLDEAIMGKPSDVPGAIAMLERLSGKTHQVVTGVAVVCLAREAEVVDFDLSDVTFRELTRGQIERYVKEKMPLDKAGGYGIQEIGDEFVESVEGSRENVMGLPVALVAEMIDKCFGAHFGL